MANAAPGAPCCSRPHISVRISPQLSWPSWRLHQPRQHRRKGRQRPAAAIALPDSLSLDAVACGTQSLLDTLVGLSPGFLQPAESLIGSDVVSLLRLQVSAESVLRLGVNPGPWSSCCGCMHVVPHSSRCCCAAACNSVSTSAHRPHTMSVTLGSIAVQGVCMHAWTAVRSCHARNAGCSSVLAAVSPLARSSPLSQMQHLTSCSRPAQALYYFLLANPSPAAGFLDFFVLNPVFQQLERQARFGQPAYSP